MQVWGFLWIMLALKIPLAALLWLVWWAIHATPETEADQNAGDDDGGIGHPRHPRPLPRGPRRRGPHGDPTAPAPSRTRTPTPARSRHRTAR